MRFWVVLFLLLVLIPSVSASIVQNQPNNFTLTTSNNIQVKTFWDGTYAYWYIINPQGTILSYWTFPTVQSWKTTGGGSWQNENPVSVNSSLMGSTLWQNYTLDSGSKLYVKFNDMGTKIKMTWGIYGNYNRNYQIDFKSNAVPSNKANLNNLTKIFQFTDLVRYNWNDLNGGYTVNNSVDANKNFNQYIGVGNAYLVTKWIDPSIEGGAQGTISITQTGVTNGSWINLTAPANATSGTVFYSNLYYYLFNDDFSDGDYTNSPVWSVGAGTWSASNYYLQQTSGTTWSYINTPQTNYTGNWTFFFKAAGTGSINIQFYPISSTGSPDTGNYIHIYPDQGSFVYITLGLAGSQKWQESFAWTVDTNWHRINFSKNDTHGMVLYLDGVKKWEKVDSVNTIISNSYLLVRSYEQNNAFDNISLYPIAPQNIEIYSIPQNHPISEKKLTTSGTPASVNLTLTPSTQIQNIQLFTNSTLPFTAIVNLTVVENSTEINSQCSNGFCTANVSFIPSNQVYNLTILQPMASGATHTGTMSYTSNLSGNVTGSGYNSSHTWVNYSYVSAGFNLTTNFTRAYNNAPVASVVDTACVFGESCVLTVTNSDAEGNALNISITVNGTKKYGASPDYSGLAPGNYSSLWNVTDFNGTLTVTPYMWSNGTFWLNITADITPPGQPSINMTANTTTSISVNSTVPSNDTSWYFWQYRVNGTSTWLYSGNTTVNNTTIGSLTSGQIYDVRVQVNDTSDNLSPWSEYITVQTATTDPSIALLIQKVNDLQIQVSALPTTSDISNAGVLGFVGGILGAGMIMGILKRKRK